MKDVKKNNDEAMAEKIASIVKQYGGATYYVGGYVRDRLRGEKSKDVDIEIHGIEPTCLESILDGLGERITVGESFGIYMMKGFSLDIAMPRTEKPKGKGHRDFDVLVDPFIGTRKAAMRRDFTINAMMEDVLTGEIVDEFRGREDLAAGVIRHVDADTFAEDELRVLRGAQFAARFGFSIAGETLALFRRMELSHLAKERVMGETSKALLKADKPSTFFQVLCAVDQLGAWFTEMKDLIGVEQDKSFHAEGDVWNHTMLVLDEAASSRDKAANPLGFMLAALTHDFGKIVSSRRINGKIHAYSHEIDGLPLVKSFLTRLNDEAELRAYVLNLVEYHMKPNMMVADQSSVKSTNKMFDGVSDPKGLIYLALADGRGSKSLEQVTSFAEDSFSQDNSTQDASSCDRSPWDASYSEKFLLKRLAIYDEYMARPYVQGRDLIQAGLTPSAAFSEYLDFAHKLRLAGVDKEEALKQTLGYARKN